MPQGGLARATKPVWDAEREAFGLQVARVVASNWQDHTVDLVTPNGASLAHVPIITPWAGTDYGDLSRPQFTPRDNGGVAGIAALPDATRDCHALIAFAKGLTLTPVVIGFFYPSVSQMMLDGLQRITRHVGGTYSAVSLDGDIWFGFNPDGSYVGFHNDNPSPPIVYGTDYDGRADPSGDQGKPHSFTAMLRNGTTIHLDGQTGNVILNASQFMQLEGHAQLDLLGRVITLTGLPAIYPGTVTALAAAPSTGDPGFVVPHLAANAAWEYVGPVASRAPGTPLARTGWTFLGAGDAVRLELTGAGTPRFWRSAHPGVEIGDPVEWVEVLFAVPYVVPPPQPYVLAWSLLGNQAISWVCPELPYGSLVFNRNQVVHPAGTTLLKKNGSTVTVPSAGSPLTVVQGDVLNFSVTGAGATDENLLTIEAIPAALPAVATWFTVDPSTVPPTVTAP